MATVAGACTPSREVATPTQRLAMTPLDAPGMVNGAEPFVSPAGGDSVLLSWLERGPDSVTVAMRLAVLDAAGHWSAPQDVIRASDLFVNWADFPSVVRLPGGRLLAHWLQRNGTGKYSYDVRLASSGDGGVTWSAPTIPHDPGVPAEHGFVTLLARADSSADVLFLNGSATPPGTEEGKGPPMRLGHSRWPVDGAAAPDALLDLRTCDCCQTAAAQTARGPVVLYRDRSEGEERDISVIRFVDGAWTTPAPLHADGWIIKGCPVNGPAVSARGDTVVAVWYTGARDTARVQAVFSVDAGATFGAPVRIDQGAPEGRVDVELLDGGSALVTWIERVGPTRSEVRARLVDARGIAEPALTIDAPGSGRATGFPRMARRADGVALAWTVPGAIPKVRLAQLHVAPR
ncbi:MAG: hypothetical protein IT355_09125 [Gemmatimonadaceae bacterium]|nr:hypothetical protein [Gemmatimonadaceae bacterium]